MKNVAGNESDSEREEENRRVKRAEWRGYTLKALESMNKELDELKDEIGETQKQIKKFEQKLDDNIADIEDKQTNFQNTTSKRLGYLSATISFIIAISIVLLDKVLI